MQQMLAEIRKGKIVKRFTTVVLLGVALALVTVPAAAVDLEEGVEVWNHDNGSCVQGGEPGAISISGECVTAADYDAKFSHDVLAGVESHAFPGRSVADVYGMTAASPAASERPRSFMGVSLPTFAEYVVLVNNGAIF